MGFKGPLPACRPPSPMRRRTGEGQLHQPSPVCSYKWEKVPNGRKRVLGSKCDRLPHKKSPVFPPGSFQKRYQNYFLRKLNFSLKRETRPPRSRIVCVPPVQAGWVRGSISKDKDEPSLPYVERVSNLEPSVITMVIMW